MKYGGAATLTTVATLYGGHKLGEGFRKSFKEDPHFKIEYDREEGITFEQASALAIRFDKMSDKFGEDPKIEASPEELYKLAHEILPQFQKEGATNKTRIPKNLDFVAFQDGEAHNHVGGRSDCQSYAILNARYINDWSRTHDSPHWVSTTVHELAHMQQGDVCNNYGDAEERVNIENTAQIVTWEVMAAQVNDGNKKFVLPLLDELKSVAMSTAYVTSEREGKQEEFKELQKKMEKGALIEARRERFERVWKDDPQRLKYILTTYSEIPLNRVVDAISNKNSIMKDLALNTKSFKVDDLAAFLLKAEEIVDETAHK